jgi:hypothetical protein
VADAPGLEPDDHGHGMSQSVAATTAIVIAAALIQSARSRVMGVPVTSPTAPSLAARRGMPAAWRL